MKLKKENILPSEHFIGSWYIPKKVCNDLINYYNRNHELGNTHEGVFKREHQPKVLDKSIKESIDMNLSPDSKEPEVMTYRKWLQICLDDYVKTYPLINGLQRFNVTENINIQYYKKGGGYKDFHFERGGLRTLKRVLVFMTYLNNVKDGGTEFKYQKCITPAKKGLTLMWPPDWTHAHKSQVSNIDEKYIITGWLSFID